MDAFQKYCRRLECNKGGEKEDHEMKAHIRAKNKNSYIETQYKIPDRFNSCRWRGLIPSCYAGRWWHNKWDEMEIFIFNSTNDKYMRWKSYQTKRNGRQKIWLRSPYFGTKENRSKGFTWIYDDDHFFLNCIKHVFLIRSRVYENLSIYDLTI